MKNYFTVITLLLISGITFGQLCKGPGYGSVPSGIKVSLNAFQKVQAIKEPIEKYEKNRIKIEPLPDYLDSYTPVLPVRNNFVQDVNLMPGLKKPNATNAPIMLASFKGIPDQGNQIPPDPYIAAGPEQVIAVVNTRFRIMDKAGNEKKTVEAVDWYRSMGLGGTIYDPKITYDHFAKRWVMVWLQVSESARKSNLLISVSVDSSAMGDWYNYALPGNQNGNDTIGTWSDYQGVGYDSVALYITTNQASFGGNYVDGGSRIRIIDKSKLYANTGGMVTWTDFWDLRLPTNFGVQTYGVRPSISYTHSNDYYLMTHSAYITGQYFTVYKVSNPVTSPAVSAYNVPVTSYKSFGNPTQLGGSTIGIEGGGTNLRNEPIYRDGYLYAVHSAALLVLNEIKGAAAHYVKIDTKAATPSAVEDYMFGSEGYYHFYPAMSVDKDHNVLLTFSRSSASEYIGAYYTSRLNTDPAGTFSGSWPIKTGVDNYVKDFQSGRNRWGDYNGCWLDPSDQNNFWTLTEYVDTKNGWGTWVGNIRLVPFKGAYVVTSAITNDFGNVEKNFKSDTSKIVVKNYGGDNLVISNFTCKAPFKILNQFSYPLTLKSFDSVVIYTQFQPVTRGDFSDTLKIASNDTRFNGISLKGKCYEINLASERVLYASSGKDNSYSMATINKSNGAGTNIGIYGTEEINGLTVNPKNKILYALSASTISAKLLRVNPTAGDAYKLYDIAIGNLGGLAFDTAGNLFLSSKTGIIYKMDLNTGKVDSICNTKFAIASIAFNPANNQMWGTFNAVVGVKDRIYKINHLTGTYTLVGQTGLGTVVNSIFFDESCKLYGTVNVTGSNDNFISIDTVKATGTVIGSVGLKKISGMAYLPGKLTDVKNSNNTVPKEFSLSQNYPNPFNPTTTINYSIPQAGSVKITIYNLLGENVKTLFDGNKTAGNYQINWNSADDSGNRVVSGIYFYEMKFSSENGSFTDIKKMSLLK